MQGAHLPSLIQTYRLGRSNSSSSSSTTTSQHDCGSGGRNMRVITSRGAIRAGAATVQGEDGKEPKQVYYRGMTSSATTSSFRHKREITLKKVESEFDHVAMACEFLRLASSICDEVEAKLELPKSKKPLRLSTTSWDLLD